MKEQLTVGDVVSCYSGREWAIVTRIVSQDEIYIKSFYKSNTNRVFKKAKEKRLEYGYEKLTQKEIDQHAAKLQRFLNEFAPIHQMLRGRGYQ